MHDIALVESRVIVFGGAEPIRRADNSRLLTLAYEAGSGRTRWASLYNGSPESDYSGDLAIDSSTNSVLVTGASGFDSDIDTVAYDLSTGEIRWTARYDGGGDFDTPEDLSIDPSTGTVYVLGTVYGDAITVWDDFGLIAYDTTTGEQRWDARYGGAGELRDQAEALVLSPSADRLYVTGSSSDGEGSYDTVVLAYET